jgi:hypothetical protein
MNTFFKSLIQPNSVLFKPNSNLIYPIRYFILNTFCLIGVFFVLDTIVSKIGILTAFENERLLMWATLLSLLQSISAYYKSKKSLNETKNTIAT